MALEIEIGGDLQEKDLNYFIKKITRYLFQDTVKNKELEYHVKALYEKIRILKTYSSTLKLSSETQSVNFDNDLTILCMSLNLYLKIRTAPHVDKNGIHINETVLLCFPGVKFHPVTIPTDGRAKPTTTLETMYSRIHSILDEYEKPLSDAPRHINKQNLTGEIARLKLAGEDLRKILIGSLQSLYNYPDQKLPHFRVI